MNHYICEFFERKRVSLKRWEMLLAKGWDRVGKSFFRQRFYYDKKFPDGVGECMPLRYDLTQKFEFTKQQKKILALNEDLTTIIRPLELDDDQFYLFDLWEGMRFGLGHELSTWVVAEDIPFPTYQVCVYTPEDDLIATSYFDIARKTQYSTIAAYNPYQSHRKLGFFTLLKEIEFALQNKRHYHYPGYAYYNYKAFDYKKTIPNTQYWDWEAEQWKNLKENLSQ